MLLMKLKFCQVDILGADILGVDILGVDILRLIRVFIIIEPEKYFAIIANLQLELLTHEQIAGACCALIRIIGQLKCMLGQEPTLFETFQAH